MPQTDHEQLASHPISWRKSTHSNPSGDCVEAAKLPDGQVALRNSRHPSGAVLIIACTEMMAFVRGTKASEFGDLIS